MTFSRSLRLDDSSTADECTAGVARLNVRRWRLHAFAQTVRLPRVGAFSQ